MVGILLAAGFSRRFGSVDKLLHLLPDGRPMALKSAENLIQVIPTSIAVLRPENKELTEFLLTYIHYTNGMYIPCWMLENGKRV